MFVITVKMADSRNIAFDETDINVVVDHPVWQWIVRIITVDVIGTCCSYGTEPELLQ